MKLMYLILAIIGLRLPYYFFIQFLLKHGLDFGILLDQIIGTLIALFAQVDVLISVIAVPLYIYQNRDSNKTVSLPVVVTTLVGLS